MKPIPETICAATREGSSTTLPMCSTSEKPYLLISMNSAEPSPTSVYVRSPALFCRTSRSSPIAQDRASARPKRQIRSHWSIIHIVYQITGESTWAFDISDYVLFDACE